MKINILGSGTSSGIPVAGCGCPVCVSNDPRDFRMRSSLYIEGAGGERVVIDTGPEFRLQAVRAGIKKLDAVLLTHPHADHLHGLDDVRPFSVEKPLPVYGNALTIAEMKERFSYVFRETQEGGGKPKLMPLIAGEPFQTGSLRVTPVPVKHGNLDILGWLVAEPGPPPRSLLYMTDTSFISEETLKSVRRPDLLIIGGLRERPHSTHFSFEEALNTAFKLEAKRAFLTHICHEHFHREIEEFCANFNKKNGAAMETGPAWDELQIILS